MTNYFYNYDGADIPIQGLFKGRSCFLIVSGPSLKTIDLSQLNQPGIITIGVNNSPAAFRPNIWVSVDDPCNFMLSIWSDPRIMKFVMHGKRNKQLWDNNAWKESPLTVCNCPNVIYYKDNEHFKPTEEFLDESTINWGNHTERCECGEMRVKEKGEEKINHCLKCNGKKFGSRSVMLAAIKIAYVLGFKKIFIVGADFKMDAVNTYAWNQNRSDHSIKSNNETYERLNERFAAIRPVFEKRQFYIFNATPNSNLNSFARIDFEDAVKITLSGFPDVSKDRTFGMYERKAVDKTIEEQAQKQVELKEQIVKINGSDRHTLKKLNHKLEKCQVKLRNALEEKEKLLTWKA